MFAARAPLSVDGTVPGRATPSFRKRSKTFGRVLIESYHNSSDACFGHQTTEYSCAMASIRQGRYESLYEEVDTKFNIKPHILDKLQMLGNSHRLNIVQWTAFFVGGHVEHKKTN